MTDRAGEYIAGLFSAEDEVLATLREEADRTGLPPIAISADDGRLLTIEIDSKHADFARRHIKRAGQSDRIEVRVGRALDVLPSLDGERFDAMFLDADKEPLPTYFDWALRLVRPGGLIIGDNALWGGRVYESDEESDEKTRGVRE